MPTTVCSKEYMDRVRTISGLNPEHPWTRLEVLGMSLGSGPSPLECDEWQDLAKKLTNQMYDNFYMLGRIEDTKGEYPKWNEIVDEARELWTAAQGSSGCFVGAIFSTEHATVIDANKQQIDDAIEISKRAVCLTERIDNAILAYGFVAPKHMTIGHTKPPGTGGMGVLGTLAVVGVAGALVVGAVMIAKRSAASGGGEVAA